MRNGQTSGVVILPRVNSHPILIIALRVGLAGLILRIETDDVVAEVPSLEVTHPPVDDGVIATSLHSSKRKMPQHPVIPEKTRKPKIQTSTFQPSEADSRNSASLSTDAVPTIIARSVFKHRSLKSAKSPV